ncbi:MAG: pyrroline-5-carboxylate reductase, partial [Candidatus Subteraquimicrobiales bacterium]|nr:pyrroline-5-carboxylate reductase [Candidatus Subteraquimicrobiales bacterium]
KDHLVQLKQKYEVKIASDNVKAVKESDVVLLAVKPQQMNDVLLEIAPSITKKVLISIAAGVDTAHIFDKLGKRVDLVRVMPNSPALVGKGISVLSPAEGCAQDSLELVSRLFSSIGEVIFLREKFQNEATALSGSGPAYFYLFVEALIEAGLKIGLSHEIAKKLVLETLAGSITMLKETDESPEILKEAVTSRGGTTEAALKVFTEAKFKETVYQAIEAAVKRAGELDKA